MKNSLLLLPVSLPRALEVCRLPHHHSDPFHRLLIAQAQAEELTVSGVGKGAAAGGRSATQSAGGATTLVDCCRGKVRAWDQLVDDCAPCALYSTTLFERPLFLGKSKPPFPGVAGSLLAKPQERGVGVGLCPVRKQDFIAHRHRR